MSRLVSLSEEAYAELVKLKTEGRSFSDVVVDLTRKEKKPLSYFFGKWPGPKKELGQMKKEIERDRKKFKLRDVKF